MQKTFSEAEIHEVATWLWQQIQPHKIIAFYGELGAGKTTLIRAMCDNLGVRDPVSSPTFSIINEYKFEKDGETRTIFHIDLYRLNDEEEAVRTGIEECLYSNNWCFVEWPERAPNIFPEQTLHIFITLAEGEMRQIEIQEK